jgi:hypothetical protein
MQTDMHNKQNSPIKLPLKLKKMLWLGKIYDTFIEFHFDITTKWQPWIKIQASTVSCHKPSLNVPTNGNEHHNNVDARLLKHSIPGKYQDEFSASVTAQFSCGIKFICFFFYSSNKFCIELHCHFTTFQYCIGSWFYYVIVSFTKFCAVKLC